MKKKIFAFFFQSTHQVGMKNVVKCYKDFFGYFNALKTHCESCIEMNAHSMMLLQLKGSSIMLSILQATGQNPLWILALAGYGHRRSMEN